MVQSFKLYFNEDIRYRLVEALRQLGHDVLTSAEAAQDNLKIPDDQVLEFAVSLQRAVITYNRRDFRKLHQQYQQQRKTHYGIILCTMAIEDQAYAQTFQTCLSQYESLENQLIAVDRQLPQTMNASNYSIHNYSIQTGNIDNSGNLTLGDIRGNVHQSIETLQTPSSNPNTAELASLLHQLREAIETDITTQPTLSEADKTEALTQIQVLAGAGQSPTTDQSKQLAKRATRILKGIAAELPHVAAIAKACDTIVPAILKLFEL